MKKLSALVSMMFALALLGACSTTEFKTTPAYNKYTPEDVLAMAKNGEPPNQIIAKLGRANSFYPLKPHDLIRLHEMGMPTEVLDYMQESYVWKVRRQERFQLPERFYSDR